MLYAERLRNVVDYDESTGLFRKKGKTIGHKHKGLYVVLRVDGKAYKAHRLAWLWMTGSWPPDMIDHIDGNALNNKFSNLRLANRLQNNHNSRAKARIHDLPRGVSISDPSGKFNAQISIMNKKKHLGTFESAEDASDFYQLAADLLHGEYAFHRCQGANNQQR